MPRYIAFLRAINVGGHTVKMSRLVALFESLGFTNVETFIASGNVIFNAKRQPNTTLEKRIEKTLESALGYAVATFVRTDVEVAAMAALELFSADERKGAHSLWVGLTNDALPLRALEAMRRFNTDHESFRTKAREIHRLAQVPVTVSKFSNAKFEKALDVKMTFRNINTLVRLALKYSPAD